MTPAELITCLHSALSAPDGIHDFPRQLSLAVVDEILNDLADGEDIRETAAEPIRPFQPQTPNPARSSGNLVDALRFIESHFTGQAVASPAPPSKPKQADPNELPFWHIFQAALKSGLINGTEGGTFLVPDLGHGVRANFDSWEDALSFTSGRIQTLSAAEAKEGRNQ